MMSLWDTCPFGSLPSRHESAITISVKWNESAKSAECRGNAAKSEMQLSEQSQSSRQKLLHSLMGIKQWRIDCQTIFSVQECLIVLSVFQPFQSTPNMILSSQIVSYAFPQVLVAERSDTELRTPVEDSQNEVYPLLKSLGKDWINIKQRIKWLQLFE